MPAKLFKDFPKDAKDLLTKNYTASGEWKMESKMKPADRQFILNPGFTGNAKGTKLTVDVDYNIKDFNLKTKTTFSNDGNIKPKLTWEQGSYKVEATLQSLSVDSDIEVVFEGLCPITGATLYDKLTKNGIDGAISYAVGPLTVGAGVAIGFGKGLQKWSAGVRGVHDGFVVSVTTDALKTYSTGVFAPLKLGGLSTKLAAQVDCGNGKFAFTAGVEAPVSDFTVKAKVDNKAAVTVALIRKFTEKWTAAVTFGLADVPKFGLTLTRE